MSALQGSLVDAVGLPGQGCNWMGRECEPDRAQQLLPSVLYRARCRGLFHLLGSITVTPFVGLGLVLDTKGYEWNNKIQPKVGMKVNKFFSKGVVSVGSAYSRGNASKASTAAGSRSTPQDWFGWQPVAQKSSRFPGSSWMEVGTLSPIEKGNIIIGLGYITQGIVAKKFSRATWFLSWKPPCS